MNIKESKDKYIKTWQNILKHVAGWEDHDIDERVNHFVVALEMDKYDSWIWHDMPSDVIIYSIIYKRIKRELCFDEHHKIRREVEKVFPYLVDFSEEQDWDYYKQKLNTILEKYKD